MNLLTTKEAADFLRMAPGTLTIWRTKRESKGPKYIKNGRFVHYDKDDLVKWLESRKIDPEAKREPDPPQAKLRKPSVVARLRESLSIPRVPRGRPRKVG